MCPPGLPFTRVIRFSVDVLIRFVPRATGQEICIPQGHIFLLTDLLLICERISDAGRAAYGPDGPEMFLCYPPLAGKHLRVNDVAGPPGGECIRTTCKTWTHSSSPFSEHVLQIVIMKKETLYVHVESAQVKDQMLRDFHECIDAGAAVRTSSMHGSQGLSD